MYGFSYGLMFIIPITCMFVFAFGFVGWRKKYPLPYYCMVVLGVVYVNYAIAYAFFPIDFWDVPGFSVKNNINFTLSLFSSDKKHLVLNMLLTLPMGMGMQFVTNMKNTYRFLVVILLSFLIEIGQLIILLAFQPIDVFFDINDMFCNVAGGAFGFGLMMIINRLYRGGTTYKKETLLGYFGQVCHNCAHGSPSLDGIAK